ncbi:hypothetical protein A2415_02640 [candidate division WWE3 bacterium RIFOXYC1_FULL_39_7]|uniref:Haem-binding uptake Tiki superfamily ChaN domain-containing protein n=2 Tax=Katanobacteria TaxID=422282 RepID=A0A1F4X9U5_UNCKA|nr:MAG: hypothetical protein A2415_02640 [candidate division WWE3 bacterium RIFOXYC1_FULL_39_7]OGC78409.1 MAG: hypothetical protein A2619_00900 [candidate division WWE3 bacterium RIFOXYD1_FULL_39_9]
MIDTAKIANIKITEFDLEMDPALKSDLSSAISSHNILAIGESHGVKENANIYYYFFKEFGFNTIALEYPLSIQSALTHFIDKNVLSDSLLNRPVGDGRFNLEYLALLRRLHKERMLKNLFCFDSATSTKTWNERDASYAKNFLNNYNPKNKTLLIAGNWHTKKETFTSEYETGELVPMCKIISDKIGDFPEIKIIYHSGSLYNFEIKQLDNGEIFENHLEKINNMNYLLHVKKATPITLW